MCCSKLGLFIYCIVQFAAFVLILVGTPLGQFRAKGNKDYFGGDKPCMTLWGMKDKCFNSDSNNIKVKDLFKACTDRRDRFQAAEAFAIISILVFGAAFVLALITFCCCMCFKWLCLILNIVGIVTACIVWACMADAYNQGRGKELPGIGHVCPAFKNMYMRYGEGFALILVAWILDIIAIPFLFFLNSE